MASVICAVVLRAILTTSKAIAAIKLIMAARGSRAKPERAIHNTSAAVIARSSSFIVTSSGKTLAEANRGRR